MPLKNAEAGLYEGQSEESSGSHSSHGIGLELGALGRPGLNNDLAGLQLMTGGRLFFRFSLWKKLFVKPSVGFFFRGQGLGAAGLSEYSIEGGATLYFTPFSPSRAQWFIGTVQRVEARFGRSSRLTFGDASTTTFGFRMGPATGVAYAIDPKLSLVSDLEAAFTFTQPTRTYLGLTAGFIYKY